MGVEARQLRHAIVLAQHKSFRVAAQALGLTQPALTKSIQTLEAQLGVRLFDRLARSVEPTAFGAALLARAAPILGGIAELEDDLRRLQGLQIGTIGFGAGPLVASGAAGRVVGEFVRRHPGLRARALVRDWRALVEALRRHEIEFFVADVSVLAEDPDLEIVETLDHVGLWLVRPGHPLASASKVGPDELRAFPVASARMPAPVLAAVRAFLGREALDGAGRAWEPEIQTESVALLEQAVMASDAVAIGPRYAHAARLRARDLVALSTDPSPLRTRLGAVRLRGRSLSPGASTLLAALLDAVRAELDER